jgi:hypothetical protein
VIFHDHVAGARDSDFAARREFGHRR